MPKVFADRRLLLKCEGKSYRLLSLTQANDGSIYIGFQNFRNIQWVAIDLEREQPTLSMVDSTPEEGKLSFHASGVVGFRSHAAPGDYQLRIRGNYLYDRHNAQAGVRHLVTVFMEKPEELAPTFPQRNSDFWLQYAESLKPFVLVLFAIPRVSGVQTIGFTFTMHIDDLDRYPAEGANVIDLKYHWVFWLIYRTKFMDNWPQQSYVCFHDGFSVPMYFSKEQKDTSAEMRLELRMPEYTIEGTDLKIKF